MTNQGRVAIDATSGNAHLIPVNVFAVGGYVSSQSSFKWTPDLWARFPNSYHIRINTFGDPSIGNCIDVERGAATPDQVETWINTRGPACKDPLLVYCNRSNMDACVAARNAAHSKTGTYAYIWEATLDGTLSSRAMTQICQVKTPSGITFADLSVIMDEKLINAMIGRIGQQLYWNPEYMERWEPRWSNEYLLFE